MNRERLPAITIIQPWASLIAANMRRYELRDWAPPRKFLNRGLAIHAGMKMEPKKRLVELLGDYEGTSAIPIIESALWKELPLGAVLCVAKIRVIPVIDGLVEPFTGKVFFGSGFVWQFEVVEVFVNPVPATGMQGFWMWEYNPSGRRAKQGALL